MNHYAATPRRPRPLPAVLALALAACAPSTMAPPPTVAPGVAAPCDASRRVIVYGDAEALAVAGDTAHVVVPLPEVGAAAVCLPSASASSVRALEAAGARVEPDPVLRIPEPAVEPGPSTAAVDQWHLARIGAPAAWQRSRGTNVTVAVLDTGVDCSHPAIRCTAGTDYVGGRPQGPGLAGDPNGHGTHVAGIVADTGASGASGVAPAAVIQSMRVLDTSGSGYTSTIARAILDAGRPGVVINMSLGGPTGATAMRDAIAAAAAAGAIIVAARGNSGSTAPSYPVCYEPVVGVAATDAADRRPSWSSYGDCTDVGAPGDAIVSTWPGGGYRALSGTSMASPVTAGSIALLVALGDRDPVGTLARTQDGAGSGLPGRVSAVRAVGAVVPGPTVTAGPTATEAPDPTDPPGPYPAPATATRVATARPTATRTTPGSCEAAGLVEKRSAIIGRFCAPR